MAAAPKAKSPSLLLPKATAVWLIENTKLTFRQIADFTVLTEIEVEALANEEIGRGLVGRNPIIVTALNPVIGYEKGAKIAKMAYAEGRMLKDVALEQTDLTREELDLILDPRGLTEGGIHE